MPGRHTSVVLISYTGFCALLVMTEFLNTYGWNPWSKSNVTTDTMESNEAKKYRMDKHLQLQAHGCFAFCSDLFVECYSPEEKCILVIYVYRLLNEYSICLYWVTVALKKLMEDLNPIVARHFATSEQKYWLSVKLHSRCASLLGRRHWYE